MCSYQGKLKPAIAYHLVNIFSREGDLVVDPFSGAGTIPYEASRLGRQSIGMDLSELGFILTLAKVRRPQQHLIDKILSSLEVYITNENPTQEEYESAYSFGFNGKIAEYFHPETLREVLISRRFFLKVDQLRGTTEWALVYASLLHILHGNRPYALSRRSHPVTPYKPSGPTEYRPLMPRLQKKIKRLLASVPHSGFCDGLAYKFDSTKKWPIELGTVDAVITSPPFFDSTRFYMTNWMRFWFTGWEKEDFSTRVQKFLETRQKESLNVYTEFFRQARLAMKSTGVLVMHLGRSPKCDMAKELARQAEPLFQVADVFAEGVRHCENHGIRDKGTTTDHTYLVLIPSDQN